MIVVWWKACKLNIYASEWLLVVKVTTITLFQYKIVREGDLPIRINGVALQKAFFEEENSWPRFRCGENKIAVNPASTVQLRDDPVTVKRNMFETKITSGPARVPETAM